MQNNCKGKYDHNMTSCGSVIMKLYEIRNERMWFLAIHVPNQMIIG